MTIAVTNTTRDRKTPTSSAFKRIFSSHTFADIKAPVSDDTAKEIKRIMLDRFCVTKLKYTNIPQIRRHTQKITREIRVDFIVSFKFNITTSTDVFVIT